MAARAPSRARDRVALPVAAPLDVAAAVESQSKKWLALFQSMANIGHELCTLLWSLQWDKLAQPLSVASLVFFGSTVYISPEYWPQLYDTHVAPMVRSTLGFGAVAVAALLLAYVAALMLMTTCLAVLGILKCTLAWTFHLVVLRFYPWCCHHPWVSKRCAFCTPLGMRSDPLCPELRNAREHCQTVIVEPSKEILRALFVNFHEQQHTADRNAGLVPVCRSSACVGMGRCFQKLGEVQWVMKHEIENSSGFTIGSRSVDVTLQLWSCENCGVVTLRQWFKDRDINFAQEKWEHEEAQQEAWDQQGDEPPEDYDDTHLPPARSVLSGQAIPAEFAAQLLQVTCIGRVDPSSLRTAVTAHDRHEHVNLVCLDRKLCPSRRGRCTQFTPALHRVVLTCTTSIPRLRCCIPVVTVERIRVLQCTQCDTHSLEYSSHTAPAPDARA